MITDNQLKWLNRAKISDKGRESPFMGYHVDKFNGVNYMATADGYRLHAVPAPEEMKAGTYAYEDGEFVFVDNYSPRWVVCIPLYNTKVVRLERRTRKSIREDEKVYGDPERRIRVDDEAGTCVDPDFLFDATQYAPKCTMLLPNSWMRPVRFDYEDGALAVVMPMQRD